MSAVRPLRVLLLNQYYPPDACSTGQHAADLGSALAARGHDVHVVCGSRAYGGGATRRVAEARIDGVAVHRVASTGLGRASLLHRVVDCGSLYPRLLQRARRIPSIDVCVALTMPPFVGMVGRALRLPLVLWVMDVFEEAVATFGVIREGGIAHRGSRAVARVVYDGATRVVSLGETMTERLVDLGVERGRLVEVHNWMPNEPARTVPVGASHARQRWELGPRPVLMYSGNLGLGHELETAVRAISQARRVVEFDLCNSSAESLAFAYRVEWLDRRGEPIRDQGARWIHLVLPAQASAPVEIIAPTASAESWRLRAAAASEADSPE